MKEKNFREAGLENSRLISKEELLVKIINSATCEDNNLEKRKKKLKWSYKAARIAAVFLILCVANVAVYAVSPDFRYMLSEKLHINNEETHLIGKSVHDKGITMKIISSHVSKNTAVVLLAFSKDNKAKFGNSLNPYESKIISNNKEISLTGIYSELSDDCKTLYCYYTWVLPNSTNDSQKVTIKIRNLICNQSQVEGVQYTDETLNGNWSLQFDLLKDKDNSFTVTNPNINNTISMCGKKLQINSVTLTDMLMIVNTKTLSDSGMPKDPLSNVNTGSGAYYGIFTQLIYENGTESQKKDCQLDEAGNIVSWYPKTINLDGLKEIHVGDVVIPVNK